MYILHKIVNEESLTLGLTKVTSVSENLIHLLQTTVSLCYNTIMSSSCIIFIVIFLKSVNSKVHVVSSQNKLAVKVGHDIFAKMGKDGIELEKIEDYSDKTVKEMLKVKNMKIFLIIHNIILFCKDTAEDDKPVDQYDTR